MNDDQADAVIAAVLELAVRLRDEVGPGVTQAAGDVLAAAGGDPVAALTVAAALIRVDAPIDAWWRAGTAPGRVDVEPLIRDLRLAPCGTHAAFNRHKSRGEDIDMACRIGERTYDRNRKRARTSGQRGDNPPRPVDKTESSRSSGEVMSEREKGAA